MRLTRLVRVLLSLSAVWAADPLAGKWKLNVDKSDFGSGPKAKSGRTRYKAQADGYGYESETDFGKGDTRRLVAPVQFDGTANSGYLDNRAVVFVSKRIDRNSYKELIADKRTGKITQVFQYSVSSDNNSLTFSWIEGGKDKQVVKWVLVYDKE